MARLDIERQNELEPQRMKFAMDKIQKLGYDITHETASWFTFTYKNWPVKFFGYSGWYTGKTVKDGSTEQPECNIYFDFSTEWHKQAKPDAENKIHATFLAVLSFLTHYNKEVK